MVKVGLGGGVVDRGGQAAALVVAWSVGSVPLQLLGCVFQFVGEELRDVLLRVGDFVCHETTETVLDRAAFPARPCGRENTDFFEGATELLCSGNERQQFDSIPVVDAVSGGCSLGLEEPDFFVVPQR